MSGGGGGGGGAFSGGGEPAGDDACSITDRVTLNSPVKAVISTLSVGDVLDVVLVTISTVQRLEAQVSAGATAGTITSSHLVQIIRCIKAGYSYEAEVLSISGGRVDVEVRLA